MKIYKYSLILLSLTSLNCNNTNEESNLIKVNDNIKIEPTLNDDENQIKKLTENIYSWKEKNEYFDNIKTHKSNNDSLYIGIDERDLENKLDILKSTNLFTSNFITQYKSLFDEINLNLKTKKLIWYVGDLPPYGNESNAWCNCQDNPTDNYWQKYKYKFNEINTNYAEYIWTWSNSSFENFSYKMKAKKINEKWYIDFMQGFNYKEYVTE